MKCFAGLLSLCTLAAVVAWSAPVRADDITIELKDFKFNLPKDNPNADQLFKFDENEGKLYFLTNGSAEASFKVPADGDYDVVITASGDSVRNSGDPAKDGPPKFKASIDGQLVGKETALTDDSATDYKLPTTLKAGEHKIVIEFTNDIYKEGEYDRNLYVNGVKLTPKK